MFIEHLGFFFVFFFFVLHDQRLDLSYWFDSLISNMHSLKLFQMAFGGLA